MFILRNADLKEAPFLEMIRTHKFNLKNRKHISYMHLRLKSVGDLPKKSVVSMTDPS